MTLSARVQEYLELGGLFNPELMDHEKVRDLIIDLRNNMNTQNPAEAQARALGWMLDNLDKPNNPVYADSTKAEQGLRDIEAMFMARNKEACVMEQGIVEALYWLDDGAQGKAHSVLTEVLAKLSAMRVKP